MNFRCFDKEFSVLWGYDFFASKPKKYSLTIVNVWSLKQAYTCINIIKYELVLLNAFKDIFLVDQHNLFCKSENVNKREKIDLNNKQLKAKNV